MSSDLVAKLGVDNSDWSVGFQKARSTASSFVGDVKSSFSSLGGSIGGAISQSVSTVASSMTAITSILGAGAAVFGAGGIALATKGMVDFNESLMSARKLSAVFEATGGAAGLTTSQVQDFASEMQSLTNFEDDATVASAAVLAAFTNIRGQTFTDTIESAMDLTTVMGGELQDNVKLLGKALNDPSEGFGKLAKAGIQFTDAQKKQITTLQQSGDLIGAQGIILDAIQDKFGGAAEATADPWKQLMNALGDVSEMIGSAVLPAFNIVVDWTKQGVEYLGTFEDSFSSFGIEAAAQLSVVGSYVYELGSSIIESVVPSLNIMITSFGVWFDTVSGGLPTFEGLVASAIAGFQNIGKAVNLGVFSFGLFYLQISEEANHVFGTVIPTYVSFFVSSVPGMISAMLGNVQTGFSNLGENIRAVWEGVLGFLKGKPFKVDLKPIMDEFEAVMPKLPDVPKRQVGWIEKGMIKTQENMIDDLKESFGKSRDDVLSKIAIRREELKSKYDTQSKVPAGLVPEDADARHEKKKKEARSKEENKAALFGTQEALKIAFAGTGPSKMEELQEKSLKESQQQTQYLKTIATNPNDDDEIVSLRL